MFQSVGHNRFEDTAGVDQRYAVVALLECVPAFDVGLLQNRPEFNVVNEIEAVRKRRGRRRRTGCALRISDSR